MTFVNLKTSSVRSAGKLNPTQRRLLSEVRHLAELFAVDYENILDYDSEWRTTHLTVAKDRIIRSQIMVWYTLTDEVLNAALCRHFFGNRSFLKLWKTKRFQKFNWHLLEELSLLQKLRYVKAIWKGMPSHVPATIERLNSIRNGIAHAFFPQNLRKSKPVYHGKSIFIIEAMELLNADMDAVFNAFTNKYGI